MENTTSDTKSWSPAVTALMAFLFLAIVNVTSKMTRATLPAGEVAGIRSIIGLTVVALILGRQQVKQSITAATECMRLYLLRAGIGICCIICFMYAINFIPLCDFTALSYTCPLIFVCMARLILKEKIPRVRWLAIAVGFGGVILVAQPEGGALSPAMLVLLVACILGAACDVVTKILIRKGQASRDIALMLFVLGTAGLLPIALWEWQTPSATDWLLLLVSGIAGALYQLSLTRSLALMPASMIAPYAYTSLLWATGFGLVFWGETFNLQRILGTICIITDGCLCYLVNRGTITLSCPDKVGLIDSRRSTT